MADLLEHCCTFIHLLYGASQTCALIALKRSENVALATMVGMLHDLYTYKFLNSRNHAKKGAFGAKKGSKRAKVNQ